MAAAIRQTFDQPDYNHAVEIWRHVASQLRVRWPKLAEFMDQSEAYMSFPDSIATYCARPIRLNV